MNNYPKIEAYKSFYQQAKDYYNAGEISAARDAFLKAVEFANDISVHATSYDVKMKYHKLAVKIVEFVKKECVHKKTITGTVPETDSVESKPAFKPQEKSFDDIKITFADVAGLYDVKKQIRFKVLSPMQHPKLAEKYRIIKANVFRCNVSYQS